MSNEIITINANKISSLTGYTSEEVAIAKATVAKGTTDSELAFFLNTCKTVGLNPFIKEIWCYKDNKGNLLVFAGRDGFLAKAQRDSNYNGIRSSEVYEGDKFSMDIANNVIQHLKSFSKDKGKIIGAYAIVFRKGGEPTIEWADIDVYDKKKYTWESHKAEMIKKVAETHALKKAFGISGVQSDYDWEVTNDVVTPLDTTDKTKQLNKFVDGIRSKSPDEIAKQFPTLIKIAKENELDVETIVSEMNTILKGTDYPPIVIED